MGYTVRVDPDTCISTGSCVRRPRRPSPPTTTKCRPQAAAADLADDELVNIARSCPVGAIHLSGEDEVELFAP